MECWVSIPLIPHLSSLQGSTFMSTFMGQQHCQLSDAQQAAGISVTLQSQPLKVPQGSPQAIPDRETYNPGHIFSCLSHQNRKQETASCICLLLLFSFLLIILGSSQGWLLAWCHKLNSGQSSDYPSVLAFMPLPTLASEAVLGKDEWLPPNSSNTHFSVALFRACQVLSRPLHCLKLPSGLLSLHCG